MNEEILSAERELDYFAGQLGRLGSSQSLSKRNGVEASYSQAYQRLVRLGVRPQIRKKYRGVTR